MAGPGRLRLSGACFYARLGKMTNPPDLTDQPHRRYNPLTGQWVFVSPHRTKRPWQGQVERPPQDERPRHDPDCYLCPGNTRASGDVNPDYTGTYVFTNDFAALLPDTPDFTYRPHELLRARGQAGTSRVLCFSPRHDLTLARMPVADIRRVIDLWADQVTELGQRWRWVQVFENRGAMMGSSNPHPHGQIWAQNQLPNEIITEDRMQRYYSNRHGGARDNGSGNLLLDLVTLESGGERVVFENDEWLILVPFWAVWPFETLILPRQPVLRLPDLDDVQRDALAAALKALLVRYDNLFEVSFPYSLGWHAAPNDDQHVYTHWQLHAHIYPPLLRSATVRKFLVGYEMLAEAQRDLTAEQAARRLRDLPDTHYLD